MRDSSRAAAAILAAVAFALSLQAGASAQGNRRTAAPAASRPAPTPSDFKIRVRMGMSGAQEEGGTAVGLERTEYIKGSRQRTESGTGGPGSTSILQCDLKRYVMINDQAKTYMLQPINAGEESGDPSGAGGAGGPSAAPAAGRRRGGVVTMTTSVTDTGDRQQMFGHTARRLKTPMTREPGPDACDKARMKVETDGWYINLNYGLNCFEGMQAAAPAASPERPACTDRVVIKGGGAAVNPGYMVKGTTTFTDAGGRTSTTTTEVLELSSAPLDAALFEPPAGYREAKSFQEFAGMGMGLGTGGLPANVMPSGDDDEDKDVLGTSGGAAEAAAETVGPKSPGVVRVGVAPLTNRAGREVSADSLRAQLVGAIEGSGVEAVPLAAADQSAAEAEAVRKECDFILYTDIVSLKQSAAGKVGGMFGRVTGAATGADRYESRVEFRLVPTGGGSPHLESNATAKEEGAEASIGAALEREAKAVVSAARRKR